MKKLIMFASVSLFVLVVSAAKLDAQTQTDVITDFQAAALISCYDDGYFWPIGEDDESTGKKKNGLDHGKKMTWYAIGPTDTKVNWIFEPKEPCMRKEMFSPFESNIPEENIQNKGEKIDEFKSPRVSGDAKGCYSYTVTCTMPGGKKITIDPIIDVPRTLLKETQTKE